jgi:hypothetical protein
MLDMERFNRKNLMDIEVKEQYHRSNRSAALETLHDIMDMKRNYNVLTKHHAMKAYWGSGCIAPHILDLGNRWR